ncbi:MAG: FAD-dependent oxidoreductase [Cryomorphaceae bacterium]
MISYWERESLLHADVVIVGAGITGLSAAASIKEQFPKKSVTVLERSIIPFGASTRNAGFACFGSLTEVLSDMHSMGDESARDLMFQRWMGLKITRKRLSDASIGFEDAGGYELIGKEQYQALECIEAVNQLVHDFLPNYIQDCSDVKAEMDVSADGALVSMSQEGQVHTGSLMASLERYVTSIGVSIKTGAEVIAVASDRVEVRDPFRREFEIRAENVVICTNAFAKKLVPTETEPGRGQVFITHPIRGLKFRGNLHIEEGFYYLRNVEDRMLFGGGRNKFFDEEKTHEMYTSQAVQTHLEEKLRLLFEPSVQWEVDQRWSGIMAFGKDKTPIVERSPEGWILAVKMSGMGIALAGYIGEEVAALIK